MKSIVTNAFITKANAEGKEWARITFVDPSAGKKATRLFDKGFLAAYPIGEAVEGVHVKTLDSAPYSVDGVEGLLTKRTTVIMAGESDAQALARSFGKEALSQNVTEKSEAKLSA